MASIIALAIIWTHVNYRAVNRVRMNVVVTCTARKTKPVPAGARLMDVTGTTMTARFKEWTRRLERDGTDRVRVLDLYCGNAWSVIRRLRENPTTGPRIRLWIVSAGQGLLSPEMLVGAYAATFSRGHADSIQTPRAGREQAEEWWNALVKWRRGKGQEPASIADVARAFPEDPLVVAVSQEYLAALKADLEAARGCLRRPSGMVIISSGAQKTGTLAENFLPCDSRFEHRFGRGRMALNAKVLSSVVATYAPTEVSITKLREHYGSLLQKLPEAPYPERVRMGDDAVRKYIRGQLRAQPAPGHTRLLRGLRELGTACEQGRFRELYREVAGTA